MTVDDFLEKIQALYKCLTERSGLVIQPMRLNLSPNTPRLEFMFKSVMTGQVAYIWFNKLTGMVGWGMTQPEDII